MPSAAAIASDAPATRAWDALVEEPARDRPLVLAFLVVNLGSPDEPTPQAVRRYLKQFLSDPRVVQVNRLLWWLILNLFVLSILPFFIVSLNERVRPLLFSDMIRFIIRITAGIIRSPIFNHRFIPIAFMFDNNTNRTDFIFYTIFKRS